MHDIKRILVAADFSNCSFLALERASELAKATGATLDVVHVCQSFPWIGGEVMVAYTVTLQDQKLEESQRSAAEAELKQFVERARSQGIEIASARVVSGDPRTTILQIAEQEGYDLIAMGTHGRGALAHLLMGSVAEKVVRRSALPVLTVRESREKKAA